VRASLVVKCQANLSLVGIHGMLPDGRLDVGEVEDVDAPAEALAGQG
jgi:hypothetical protein